MNIALVNSDFGDEGNSEIMPLTMYSLGGIIRSKGHSIKIYDPIIYIKKGKDFNTDLVNNCLKYDIIAFSCNSFNWARVKMVIIQLRNFGYRGIIVIGGVHATHCYKYLMETNDIDYILCEEGDISFPLFLDAIENKLSLTDVPQLIYRDKEKNIIKNHSVIKENFYKDDVLPAYDLLDLYMYDTYTFESSRGCYGNCTFCSIIYKKCWRGYNAESVIERLENIDNIVRERVKKSSIVFTDDCFTGNRQRAKDILKILVKTKFKDYFFLIESRLKDFYDLEYVELLKQFPNINVQIGIESGYDEGLLNIKKGIRYKDIFECGEIIYKNGLSKSILYSFIIGFPWETKSNILDTIKTVGFLNDKYNIVTNCIWWLPLPSKEFDILKEMNKKIDFSLFDKPKWYIDTDIMCDTHPLLSIKDINDINKIMKLYSDFGVSLNYAL